MSAPPLPDAFGNYALGDFVEVVSPPAIDWLPQTPGWWVVGAVIAVLVLRKVWQRFKFWYRNRYRREALARLARLRSAAGTGSELVRELNTLLKLTAIAANAREQVASLTGAAWPEYLNAQCESPTFNSTLAPLLASGSYGNPDIDDVQRAQLFDSATVWIRQHRDYHA